MTRKRLLVLVCVGWAASLFAQTSASPNPPARSVLYASTGPILTQYSVDAAGASIAKGRAIRLPANVQYAWPHPSKKFFYIVWSDGGASVAAPGATVVPRGTTHGAGAFSVDPKTGELRPFGHDVALPSRPIHVSVDITGTHLLIAYNDPSGFTVHQLNADGSIGAEVKQPKLDTGIYAHQIRADPSNRAVFLVTRGNGPTKDKAEDRGALKVFHYHDGVFSAWASVAPNRGVDFQPRHLDFHPTQPWVYVSLERQKKLQMYRMTKDGGLDPTPVFTKDSVVDPTLPALRQNAGTLHIHPNGKFLYQANRSAATDIQGRAIAGGGENTIAVYSLNQQTGEPTRIQNAGTHGAEPRTFALDPSARILVAGNQMAVYDAAGKQTPASLALFRVGSEGKLEYVRKYDVDTKEGSMFWMGIVALP